MDRLLYIQLYPTRTQALYRMFFFELREKHLVGATVFLMDSAPWLWAALHRHGPQLAVTTLYKLHH